MTREQERSRLQGETERAEADVAEGLRLVDRLGEQYAARLADGDDAAAAAVLDVLKAKRTERDGRPATV